MIKCIECEGGCSCHINPPCSYCVEHSECDKCGKMTCNESDESDNLLCFDCWEEVAE